MAAPALLLLLLPLASSHHVLFMHTTGTKSHLIVLTPLVEELLFRGSAVTAVFYNSIGVKHENFTEILLPPQTLSVFNAAAQKKMNDGTTSLNPSLWWWSYTYMINTTKQMALDPFKPEKMKELLRTKPKIDSLVTVMQPNAIFAEIFDCPIIQFSPIGSVLPLIFEGTSNVINLSIQPFPLSPFIEPMTFLQRLFNNILPIGVEWFVNLQTDLVFEYQKEYLVKELGMEVMHPRSSLRKRTAIMIACSHPVTHGAWQYAPTTIEVGGLQLKDASPLPSDLQEFMDSATDGAILVSFGSSLKADQMPQEKVQVFMDTFKQLGMKVIWKWDVAIPGLPDNILLSSWLPQQDLLAHPNLKVFVTHGGLGSLVEAIFHKAVIVGIPLSNDQKPNLLRAERHGYAMSLNWDDITAEELVAGIRKAMGDKEMAANLERIHTLYMDREQRPAEKAAWWVEYVCRHKGADWLKTIGEDVPFYQYHHLDLILALTTTLLICLIATFLFWRAVFRCCCQRKTKTE